MNEKKKVTVRLKDGKELTYRNVTRVVERSKIVEGSKYEGYKIFRDEEVLAILSKELVESLLTEES